MCVVAGHLSLVYKQGEHETDVSAGEGHRAPAYVQLLFGPYHVLCPVYTA